MHETHPVPLTFHIPKPGPHPTFQVTRPALSVEIGPELQPKATYLLDTGVGLGFACIKDGFDLLEKHYGRQLCYVESVEIEWRSLGIEPDEPAGDWSKADRAKWERQKMIVPHARLALEQARKRFGPSLTLTSSQMQDAQKLVSELRALPPPIAPERSDLGECATIQYAKVVRGQCSVVVVSNDDRARRLTDREGIAHRNMHTVLREMVLAKHLAAEEAHNLCTAMRKISELPTHARPDGPAKFC